MEKYQNEARRLQKENTDLKQQLEESERKQYRVITDKQDEDSSSTGSRSVLITYKTFKIIDAKQDVPGKETKTQKPIFHTTVRTRKCDRVC